MTSENKTQEPSMVQSLLAEMSIDPHDFIVDRPERIADTREAYEDFCQRWEPRVGKARIDLFDVPRSWLRVIDGFLTYMYEKDTNAQVIQLKYKFGGIRLYTNTSDPDLFDDIRDLESALFDERLVY